MRLAGQRTTGVGLGKGRKEVSGACESHRNRAPPSPDRNLPVRPRRVAYQATDGTGLDRRASIGAVLAPAPPSVGVSPRLPISQPASSSHSRNSRSPIRLVPSLHHPVDAEFQLFGLRGQPLQFGLDQVDTLQRVAAHRHASARRSSTARVSAAAFRRTAPTVPAGYRPASGPAPRAGVRPAVQTSHGKAKRRKAHHRQVLG